MRPTSPLALSAKYAAMSFNGECINKLPPSSRPVCIDPISTLFLRVTPPVKVNGSNSLG
eukprot:CAMPEP_0184991330 /NCGR_PEP_ID=MMETSP1098-20130426/36229_1 /TAXON_ID=89044 /ORGANISM="Spumella elongata, Strain CCAP 955/1" /LENGTH=58 /DNA_ID=CAMNT_0027516737 /DNA_START=152 /DNA_END=328 /DNA_ORIENTATION=-